MATRYAVATGNWSATATWDGGTLPTSSDDVYADGKTVTIDQNVTVLSLRTTQRSGGTAGGGFTVSGAYTITASGTGILAGTTSCLTCSNTSGTTVTISAALTGGSSTSAAAVVVTSTGTVTVTGALTGGSNSGTHGLAVNGAATVNVTGDVTAVGGNGINVIAAATVSVVGNALGAAGAAINSNAASVITLTGNATGSGSNVNGIGVVSSNASATVSVVGTLTASAAVAAQGASTFTFTGPFISSSTGIFPIYCSSIVKLSAITNNEFRFKSSGAGTASLWSSDVNSGAPSAANVRSGTKFGVSNEFTGTCAVPAAASVGYGVPVDNTTGTAALAPSDIAAVVGAQIAAALDSTP